MVVSAGQSPTALQVPSLPHCQYNMYNNLIYINGNSGLRDHLIPLPHLGVEGVPIAAGEGEDSARTEADTEADTEAGVPADGGAHRGCG